VHDQRTGATHLLKCIANLISASSWSMSVSCACPNAIVLRYNNVCKHLSTCAGRTHRWRHLYRSATIMSLQIYKQIINWLVTGLDCCHFGESAVVTPLLDEVPGSSHVRASPREKRSWAGWPISLPFN